MWLVQDRNMSPSFVKDSMAVISALELPLQGIWINQSAKIQGLSKVLDSDNFYILRSGTKTINAITDAKSLADIIDVCSERLLDNLGVKLLNNLKAGVFFNREKFDFSHYATFDLPLLNSDSQFLWYSENLDRTFSCDTFVKPF